MKLWIATISVALVSGSCFAQPVATPEEQTSVGLYDVPTTSLVCGRLSSPLSCRTILNGNIPHQYTCGTTGICEITHLGDGIYILQCKDNPRDGWPLSEKRLNPDLDDAKPSRITALPGDPGAGQLFERRRICVQILSCKGRCLPDPYWDSPVGLPQSVCVADPLNPLSTISFSWYVAATTPDGSLSPCLQPQMADEEMEVFE
ncbi:MAG: hypothetical protein KDD60_12565 [Bdellovibrionales bacterium]|nr:hypothetical protein [Bdellovibrionales bacterium]